MVREAREGQDKSFVPPFFVQKNDNKIVPDNQRYALEWWKVV